MSVNFFQADCETITSAVKFGICDGENTYPAFLNFDALVEKWIAEVENEEEIEVIFTAIDNCIDILDENGETQSRCDAMMRYAENLIFIELKEVRTDWIKGGIGQLKETILYFKANQRVDAYSKKRAFLANRKHPRFKFRNVK